ncbi:MAG TPA: hydrogenase maturation protease, partial [Pirellulales bacterium]
MSRRRILIAGIGNIFLGDDGFGSEVARRLLERSWPEGVEVRDFGIRGLDLAFALMEPYDLAILIDAVPRGEPPGTLFLIEPDVSDVASSALDDGHLEAHAVNPVAVLRLVQSMGGEFGQIVIVGCEPADFGLPDEGRMGLSPAVVESVERAVVQVERLVNDWIEPGGEPRGRESFSATVQR